MRDDNFLIEQNARAIWHPMAHPADMHANPPKIITGGKGTRVTDIHGRELLDAVGHHLLQRGAVPDVDLTGQGLPPGGLDASDRLFEVLERGQRVGDRRCHRPTDVDRDDVGALAGQPNCMSSSLPAGGPGNERHPAFE